MSSAVRNGLCWGRSYSTYTSTVREDDYCLQHTLAVVTLPVVAVAFFRFAFAKWQNDHPTPNRRPFSERPISESFELILTLRFAHISHRHTWEKLYQHKQWQDANSTDKQLNQHFDAGTIGMAVPHPPKDPHQLSQVFQLHWARTVKSNGIRKSLAWLEI